MAKSFIVFRNAGLSAIKNVKSLDPHKVGTELQKHDGNEEALEAAKNPRNPLNRHLEWDDAVCGVAHRLGQIASLRSCIRLYDDETDETSKAFIGLRADTTGHKVRYYTPEQIIDSVVLQKKLIEGAVKKLDAFSMEFRELMDLCDGVKTTRDRLLKELDNLGRGASA